MTLAALQLAQQELGAGTFEGHRKPSVHDHRVLRNPHGRHDVASSGQPHAATPRTDGEHPRAVETATVVLEYFDERLRFSVAAECDHGLDRVGNERGSHDLGAGKVVENIQHRLQCGERLGVPAERNLK